MIKVSCGILEAHGCGIKLLGLSDKVKIASLVKAGRVNTF